MDSEKDLLRRDLSKAETKEEVENVMESAKDYGHDDIIALAETKLKDILAKAEAAETTPPSQVSQVQAMGGDVAVAEGMTDTKDAEIDAVEADAETRIKKVEAAGAAQAPERPPIPPLPEKSVMAENIVAPAETAEDEVKTKKFTELQTRFDQMIEKKATDPENPVNKVSLAIATDKEVLGKVARSMGTDGAKTSRLGITQAQLERALPDLLEKGLMSSEDYGIYISLSAYIQTGIKSSKPDMPRLNKLMEMTPIKVLDKAAGESPRLGNVLDDWYAASQEEIAKEKASPRKSDEKILTLVSNAGRFSPKEELATLVPETVDGYLKSNSNIVRLRQEDGTYPVIGNLYEIGFADQAERILEKGLSNGSISPNTILEYQKKGYIASEKGKAMLDKAGFLS